MGAARTDLLTPELTHPLARQLYHTIHDKLLKLPDAVDVFPTHGAGSFCVAPTSAERTTTIGHERMNNTLAQAQSEEEFVKRALEGLSSYPTYYKYLRAINQKGAQILGGVPVLSTFSASEVKARMDADGAWSYWMCGMVGNLVRDISLIRTEFASTRRSPRGQVG